VRNLVELLTDMGRFRAALGIVAGLPVEVREHPRCRAAVAGAYRAMGLHASALAAYGPAASLAEDDRRRRRWLWWRTGGPLWFARSLLRRAEDAALGYWREYSGRGLQVFDGLPWPAGFDPSEARSRLDHLWLRSAVLSARFETPVRAIRWVVNAGSAVAGWLTLIWVAHREVGLGVLPATAVAFIGVVVAWLLRWLIFFRFANSRTWLGVLMRGSPAGLITSGTGFAIYAATTGWPRLLGAVLLVTAALAFVYAALVLPITAAWVYLGHRLWRRNPREDIVDELVKILGYLDGPDYQSDLVTRSWWAARLEYVAVGLESRLLTQFRFADPGVRAWAEHRTAGAAAAIRHLQRLLAAPVPGTWPVLVRHLRHDAVTVASGNLGALRWRTPSTATRPRRRRRQVAAAAARTVLFAALPLAAVFAVQPVLRLDEDILGWARLVGLAWAVLYIVISFDATLRDKIEVTSGLTGLFTQDRGSAMDPLSGQPRQRTGP
jgi:hypothetical protein